jgi:hypothetical protein
VLCNCSVNFTRHPCSSPSNTYIDNLESEVEKSSLDDSKAVKECVDARIAAEEAVAHLVGNEVWTDPLSKEDSHFGAHIVVKWVQESASDDTDFAHPSTTTEIWGIKDANGWEWSQDDSGRFGYLEPGWMMEPRRNLKKQVSLFGACLIHHWQAVISIEEYCRC